MGREEAKRRSGVERREASDAATLSPIQMVCLDRQMALSKANYLQSGDHLHPEENLESVTKKYGNDVLNAGCIYRCCKKSSFGQNSALF